MFPATPVQLCGCATTFNSIEWILSVYIKQAYPTRKPRKLSIPLNGFLLLKVARETKDRKYVDLSITLNGFLTSNKVDDTGQPKPLSIPLNGFCIIASHVHCGKFSHFHYVDSIPLSPRVGAPCIWCRVGYLSFTLTPPIRPPTLVSSSYRSSTR